MSACQVKEINDVNGFSSLRPFWNELLLQNGQYTVHMQFEWLYTWWKYFSAGKRLRIIVVEKEKRILGIAPLMESMHRLKGLFPYKRIFFLGQGLSDWSDFLVAKPRHEMVEMIVDYLASQTWGELVLHNLPERSPNLAHLCECMKKRGAIIEEHTTCYYIPILGSWEEFFKTRTSYKFVRRDLSRIYNHLSARPWRVLELRGSHVQKELESFRGMYDMSQDRKSRSSIYEDERTVHFIDEILTLWGEADHVRLYYLVIDGEYAAFMLGFFYNGIFFWWNTGFNQKYANLSPSKVLLNEVLKICYQEGIHEFNFMRGGSEYKSKWADQFFKNYTIRWYSTHSLGYRMINNWRHKI